MSSQSDSYSLVTLNDRVVPGFAGIMRASMLATQSRSPRENQSRRCQSLAHCRRQGD
jgi:hypothetical protein